MRSFVAVADEGNLTRASRRLHASQAAVSGQLKALEEELGVKLFDRSARGMRLTDAGKRLKARAEAVLDAARELNMEAGALREGVRGVARVGLNTDASLMRVDRLVSELTRNHPELGLHFQYCDSVYAVGKLRSDELDLAFAVGEHAAGDLSWLELPPAGLAVAGPAKWKKKLQNATAQDLAAFPWLGSEIDCPFEKVSNAFFDSHNISPCRSIVADDESIMRTLMLAGEGLTMLLEEEALKLERDGLAVIWRGDEEFRLPYSLFWLQKRDNDRRVRAVRDAVSAVWLEPKA